MDDTSAPANGCITGTDDNKVDSLANNSNSNELVAEDNNINPFKSAEVLQPSRADDESSETAVVNPADIAGQFAAQESMDSPIETANTDDRQAEPVPDHQEPSSDHQEPSSDHQEPSSDHQGPSSNQQEPSSDHQEPSSDYQEPSSDRQEPSSDHQEPGFDHKVSRSHHIEPASDQIEPALNHQEPGTDDDQEPVSNQIEPTAATSERTADNLSSSFVEVIDSCQSNNQGETSDQLAQADESEHVDSEVELVLNVNESSDLLDDIGELKSDQQKSGVAKTSQPNCDLNTAETSVAEQGDSVQQTETATEKGRSPSPTNIAAKLSTNTEADSIEREAIATESNVDIKLPGSNEPTDQIDADSNEKEATVSEINAGIELPSNSELIDRPMSTDQTNSNSKNDQEQVDSQVAAAQTEKSKADDGNKATNDTPKEPSTIAKHPPAIRARPTPGSSTMIDLTLSDDEADNTTSAANSRKRPQAVISGAATASSQSADNQPSVASVAASSDNRSHGNSESHDGTSSAKRSRTDSSILPSLDAVLETSNQESHLYVPPFTLPALSEVTSMVSNRIFRLERDVRFLKEKLDKQQNKMRSLLTMNRRLDTEILMQKSGRPSAQNIGVASAMAAAQQQAVHNPAPTAAAVHHQQQHQHQQAVVMLQAPAQHPVHQHHHQQQQHQQLRLHHQPAVQQVPANSSNRMPAAATRQMPNSAITIDLTSEDEPQAASSNLRGLIGAERRKARTGVAGSTAVSTRKDRSLPAPLPVTPAPLSAVSTSKLPPSRATLTLERTPEGVTLQWDLTDVSHLHAGVKAYEIWSYSEVLDERQPRRRQPPSCPWAKVGDVKALPLPMSCSLTQIEAGSMFHFAVRALDVYNRFGRWSNVCSVPVPLQAVRPSPGSSAANMRTGSQQQFMGTVLRA
ncbi:hypothetical protein BOX15_Mlig006933g2 [Macrostomum lignano]|uniref:Activating transcription factor 7-interacting protein Fn3 domain-containing protein n=1 Tax=Macrostomum lignano TaxID=282301 RepID=A0A267EF70_9PLAT|nr:hypothetical protein BOX15_Mlig006933g2 [Macrostomum lignano]